MWAVRRASTQFRNQGLASRVSRICCGKTEVARCCSVPCNAEIIGTQEKVFDGMLCCTRSYSSSSIFLKSHGEVCFFSSQADTKTNGEDDDDLEDGFSDLETPQDTVPGDGDDLSSASEGEGSVDTAVGEKKSPLSRTSEITKAILNAPALPVSKVLDKWVEEGNEVTRTEVSLAMLNLRRRRLFVKALQLSEWVEAKKHFEFDDKNYASRLDLIAKVKGLYSAENYIKQIPESFRNEKVYRTLLANCVSTTNVKKGEQLFNKMKDLGFPITCFACNQLLLLYKRTDKKKIADVLLLMEKENIKPTIFTYQILIDVKGQANDITGMEQIVETMKDEGLEPSTEIQTLMARYYAASGEKDKAEAVLKEIEGDDIKKNRWVSRMLIPIYASLGRGDEVDRIWNVCEHNPRLEECLAVIEAWGQLNQVEKAEEAFEKMLKKLKKPSSKHYTALLKVYANHKMLSKGKDLVRRMGESGCLLGPLTWDAIVKLYVSAGEVEKADSILGKAIKQKRGKPLFSTYMAIMDKYAAKGDVHNAEKMFQMMRQGGYTSRLRQFQALILAYVNSKTPAYGFSDRLKADNVFPNKSLAALMGQADPFKKTALSELLE
ncbi:hypothetical protein ACS0TY_024799 [Phlomoides rotata]